MLKEKYKFTPQVLETIIDKNLSLYQYYQYLYPILKALAHKNDEKLDDCEIKLAITTKQLKNALMRYRPKIDSTTVSSLLVSAALLQEQSYEFDIIEQALNSKQFIQKLHPYINSLLTTTNIGIAKQALRIHMLMASNIERARAIHRIKYAVNILTLHQMQKNTTSIICNLEELNNIFSKIGLIASRKQYEFYYHELWDDLPLENSVNDLISPVTSHGDGQPRKILQIYDLLPLAVQMQQIQVLKTKLRQWLSSDEYRKYYSKATKIHKRKLSNVVTTNDGQQTSKQIIDQNLNVIKLKIQYMNSTQLLQQTRKRQYNLDEHHKKYLDFRKDLLYFHDKEQNKKKFFNSINAKSTKTITTLIDQSTKQNSNMKYNKSLVSSNASRIKSSNNMLTGQVRREMQSKIQQQSFNLKILNGVFVREQILADIAQKKANFLDNGQTEQSVQLSEKSITTSQRTSVISSKYNFSNDYIDSDTEKQNRKSKGSKGKSIRRTTNLKTKRINDDQKQKPKMFKQTSINISGNSYKNGTNSGSGEYFESLISKVRGEGFFGFGEKIMRR